MVKRVRLTAVACREFVFAVALAVVSVNFPATAATKNGFVLDEASIPVKEILQGGPPRDGIPALYYPEFVEADEANYLSADDRVLGVVVSGKAKAYPVRILDWHEIVNDEIDAQKFSVTYCPLCGTGMVFTTNITVDDETTALSFGVSGLLYQSDVLLYDRQTESLWSQVMGEAVVGPLKGTSLPQMPVFHTSWRDWRTKHPTTQVLSLETGFGRDYTGSPYDGYDQSRQLYFNVSNKAPSDYHPKERVLGVEVDGVYKAYPFVELFAKANKQFTDTINGRELKISWDDVAETAYVRDVSGKDVVSLVAFWFAWYTFHPETEVFTAD